MASADAYVSLHRSEGFGLTLAESMLLGKPVVATGYSGNMDFMTADNSYLVDYQIVPITDKISTYERGMCWAEPSIEHAAKQMGFDLRRSWPRSGSRRASQGRSGGHAGSAGSWAADARKAGGDPWSLTHPELSKASLRC